MKLIESFANDKALGAFWDINCPGGRVEVAKGGGGQFGPLPKRGCEVYDATGIAHLPTVGTGGFGVSR